MRVALDTSILVSYFIEEDKLHSHALNLINQCLSKKIEYTCLSKINIAEMGYVIERITNNTTFAFNCMTAASQSLLFDVLELNWDFIITIAHLKAKNSISFCDNATITAAQLTKSYAVFTKEKEIVSKERNNIEGADILFLEDISFDQFYTTKSKNVKKI